MGNKWGLLKTATDSQLYVVVSAIPRNPTKVTEVGWSVHTPPTSRPGLCCLPRDAPVPKLKKSLQEIRKKESHFFIVYDC